ncbi:class F sortase [Planosporangium flavigriseum]|uniref:class F sortase n=1 Tax=Planosporangium flavigriseum TaxID=373681 RepID=UPI00194F997F|nr:class F sortase [Planosporangium flavigriseum]
MRCIALAALTVLTVTTPAASRPTVTVPPTAPHVSAGQPTRVVLRGPRREALQPAALPRSVPVQVWIPAIDAASSLLPLQLNPDRTVQVPPLSNPMQAGWYALGPSPGEMGPSVILGHVDGHNEPGIFFRLHEIRPGDLVLVTRQDGTTAQFVVHHTEQVSKDHFPTEKVYGPTASPGLRLITCGGSFDWFSGNYRDNLIVFADFTTSE